MQESFILFTKRKLKTCVLLGTSSEVKSLLEIKVFLIGVTDLEAFYLRSPAPGAYIESFCAMGTCTKDACTKGACTKGACIKGACLGGAGTKDTCTGDTYTRGTKGASMENACTRGADIIEYSRIHL